MSLSSRVSRLVPDLAATLERFPACVLSALALCIVFNLEAGDVFSFDRDELARISFAGAAAFLAGGAAHLFALGRAWASGRSALLALAAAGLAALLCYFYTSTGGHFLFVLPALTLALMVAAYLRPGASEEALWLFNARLGMAIALAIVITVIFGGGLSAILASLEYLFEFDIHHSLYEHTWVTAATLVGPVYGLSLMPADLDEKLVLDDQPGLLDRGISVLINYVMVPIASVYVVILHLYAAKIALTFELPKGQIGIMVLLFGLGGTATYLIARPWAGRGTRLLRWFLGSWFWFTIVPAALLAIAVWQRVADYGITPDRYGLVLIGIWLIAMAAYLAARRMRADSRVILASLGVLLLIGSFGPWGARDLSIASQMERLVTIMQAHGYLENDRLVETIPAKGTLPAADRSTANSIVGFLREVQATDQLAPFFEGRKDSPFASDKTGWQLTVAINTLLHFEHVAVRADGSTSLSYTASAKAIFSTGANVRISGPHQVHLSKKKPEAEQASQDVLVIFEGTDVVITQGERTWRVARKAILERAAELHEKPYYERPAFTVEASGVSGTVSLLMFTVIGRVSGPKESLDLFHCWVLLPAE